jgi:hypothetical protein
LRKAIVGVILIFVLFLSIVTLLVYFNSLDEDYSPNGNNEQIEEVEPKLVIGSNEYTIDYGSIVLYNVYKIENQQTYKYDSGWDYVGDGDFIRGLGFESAVLRPSWNNISVIKTSTKELLFQLVLDVPQGVGYPYWWEKDIHSGGCLQVGDEIVISGYNPIWNGLRIYYEFWSYDVDWENRDRNKLIGEIISPGDFSIKWNIPEYGKYRIYVDNSKIFILNRFGEKEAPHNWNLAIDFYAGYRKSSVSIDISPPSLFVDKSETLSITLSEIGSRSGMFYLYLNDIDRNWLSKLFEGYAEAGNIAISWKPPHLGSYEMWAVFAPDDYATVTTSYECIKLKVVE